MTEAERQDFALELLEVFADFLCSPSRTEEYEEKAFFSRGMNTRVERRYEVLAAMEVIRSRNIDDTRTLQEILAKLLPPFAPVEDKSVPEEA